MEGILDAIFSNIFIIMALLAGLFGFFKNEDEKKVAMNDQHGKIPIQSRKQAKNKLYENGLKHLSKKWKRLSKMSNPIRRMNGIKR